MSLSCSTTNYNKKNNLSILYDDPYFRDINTYDYIEELCENNDCDTFLHDDNIYENHLLNNMKKTFYKSTVNSENPYFIEKNNDLLKSVLEQTELYYRISVNNENNWRQELHTNEYSDWIPLSNASSSDVLTSLNMYLSRQYLNNSVKKRYELTDSYKNDILKTQLDNEITAILSNTHEFMSSIEGIFNEYSMCSEIDVNRYSQKNENLDFVMKTYKKFIKLYQIAQTKEDKKNTKNIYNI